MEKTTINKTAFTVRSSDLARAHGVTQTCISAWVKKGAFPHATVGTEGAAKAHKRFHTDCMTYTMGRIKGNMAKKQFTSPFFHIPSKVPKRHLPSPLEVTQNDFKELKEKLDTILDKVNFIEKELL